jgi:serine protease Do
VEPGSSGAGAGLRKGDVILEVNREKIKNEMDYQQVMEKVKPEQGALFLVGRGGSTFFVSVKEEK